MLEFDNLTSDLKPHRSLCTALTSEHITGRILGVSRTANVSTKTLFLSSGNNVGPIADMARRCVTINLEPNVETPATRTFKHTDLVGDLRRRRGHFVSQALTIIRAWQAAGGPMTPCPQLGSYGAWSKWCRQPLLWLGLPDPAHSVFKGMQEDPEREAVGRLSWDAQFGSKEVMVRDLVERAKDISRGEDLLEVLMDVAGDRDVINRKKLGWWIKRHAGQPVDGKKIQ